MIPIFTSRASRAASPLIRQSLASCSASRNTIRYASTSSSSSSSPSSFIFRITASYSLRISFALPQLPSFFNLPHAQHPTLALAAEATPQLPSYIQGHSDEAAAAEDSDPLKWDGFLNAVPKSKTSHSRKRMRSANKGLKDRVDFVHCQACGTPKRSHHICASCYSDISRRQKQEAAQRAKENPPSSAPSPAVP